MSLKIKLKEIFEAEAQYGAFYTGGSICFTSDGRFCLCQNGNKINVVTIETLAIDVVIGESGSGDDAVQEDSIYTFALSADDSTVVTAHRSGLLKLWSRETGKLNKIWKSIHKGPIVKLAFDHASKLIASGGSDSLIRIWDFQNQVCLGTLRGSEGIVNLLHFHPNSAVLLGASDNNKIFAWNLATREIVKTFEGHFSRITDLSFTSDFEHFVSAGRDKVLILWDYFEEKQVRTIPVYEALEACFILGAGTQLPNGYTVSDKSIVCGSAGEDGVVKFWDMQKSKNVYQQSHSLISKAEEEGGLAITYAFYNAAISRIALVSADHNIIVHEATTFAVQKQLIGFSDEILDLVLMSASKKKKSSQNYLVMATNSKDIKLYDTATMNCNILSGHSDIVLSLAGRKKLLVSGGKDNSVRLWRVDGENFAAKCVAYGLKHSDCVGSVALSNLSDSFCVSVGQDKCMKIWQLPVTFDDEADNPATLICRQTVLAHDKDINCVAVAPNDKMIATASQDKTAKLWSTDDLSLLGVLRGHKRGLWTVRFSPVDQILLSSSADSTIKLWSLNDMQCLKSFEGHDCSVLKADFLNNGLQIVSAGTDGLVKVWSIKTSECLQTLDKHENRVWALVVDDTNDTIYTGGSDSLVVKWKDVTEAKKLKDIEERQELMLQEQELNNLISNKKMLKALRLALKLDRPFMTLKIINNVIKQQEEDGLEQTITKLNDLHKESLLQHAINWNTNSRNTRPAQLVISILLKEVLSGTFKVGELQKTLEAAMPYSERHFTRMTQYLKDLKFVEFTLKCMQPHVALDVEMKEEAL